jgi:tripartite-type tricarboxylate transporter receptor subunit TctC
MGQIFKSWKSLDSLQQIAIAGAVLTAIIGVFGYLLSGGTHYIYVGLVLTTMVALVGQIDLAFGDPSIVPAVRAGSVKAIAVTAKQRLSSLPDVPTAEESGLPGFAFANWVGIFAPKGTPKEIIGKLNDAVGRTLAEPAIRERLVDLGVEIPSREQQMPDAFAARQKSEAEQWWPIIKAAGIKPE